jgi:hypothetical protein
MNGRGMKASFSWRFFAIALQQPAVTGQKETE